jgi:DNA-binding NtrC family response regulator
MSDPTFGEPSLKVLVADDSASIRHVFSEVAFRSSVPVDLVFADNGVDCLKLLAQGDFALAFVDVNMPGLDGLEAVASARRLNVRTVITLMSGSAGIRRLTEARKLGAYDFLIKPFRMHEVEAVIKASQRLVQPVHALVVDDSATVRRVIEKVLSHSMFNLAIEEAPDGESALACARRQAYEVAFLDWNLPAMPGLETLQKLLQIQPRLKVIMISSEQGEDRVRRALDLGALCFLYKPFYAADVDRVLRDAFGLRAPALPELERIAAEDDDDLEEILRQAAEASATPPAAPGADEYAASLEQPMSQRMTH